MTTMRAKFMVQSVEQHTNPDGTKSGETLRMHAVARSDGYPADGHDDDNTFARWSPSGEFRIYIANPNLWDKFVIGDKYYMDFTKA